MMLKTWNFMRMLVACGTPGLHRETCLLNILPYQILFRHHYHCWNSNDFSIITAFVIAIAFYRLRKKEKREINRIQRFSHSLWLNFFLALENVWWMHVLFFSVELEQFVLSIILEALCRNRAKRLYCLWSFSPANAWACYTPNYTI